MNNEFEQLSTEDQELLPQTIQQATTMIWEHSSKNYGVALKDFEYNETCVKYIEDYLARKVRTRILKWKHENGGIIITRVRTQNGVASSAEKHIYEVLSSIMSCSILFGQCAVKIFDGKWKMKAGETVSIEVFGRDVQIFWKCLKYVTLGDEDSLLTYLKSIRNLKYNESIVKIALDELMLEKKDYHKIEQWMDANGKVQRMIIIGNNNEILKTIFVSN